MRAAAEATSDPDASAGAETDREAAVGFAPHVLRDYALLADGYRGALVGPRGEIPWLCAPRWDSPGVCAELIGGSGVYAVTPTGRFVWGGYYEPGTLIWRGRWVTSDATVECRDTLAFPGRPDTLTLLRRVEGADGDATVDVVLNLSADFGRAGVQRLRRLPNGDWLIRIGDLHGRWSGAEDAGLDGRGALRMRLRVRAGDHHDLVLQIGTGPELISGARPDPDLLWGQTEAAWQAQVPSFEHSAAPRDSVHAYAVLRGMTVPGGGMVAAATLGLPERAEAGRNYDYRYVWLRDQAYAGMAAGVQEPHPLLDEAVAFTTARVLEQGDRLAPAYTIDGGRLPDETTLKLPGYPGGTDVVGNWVNGQFQLDSYGEMLQLYATSARHDHLRSDDQRAVEVLLQLIRRRWHEPDAGIWEIGEGWWTHSRLACVAGLRAIARRDLGVDPEWITGLADTILDDTSRRCLGPDQVWRQRPDRPGVDAALLLPPVRGALSPYDPRSMATLHAVEHQLVEDGYVYRFAADDHRPLGEAEGAFSMCGFALSLAYLAVNQTTEAFRWFERQRAACGPPGLFAEEYDVQQRQLRGNLPQAFVHALLLECSQRLSQPPP
ncbi:MAG TPA: glycoside hydrolase family 15 protein [Microlunatus sp.]|nr:glycoside hydrolase family 15 protein [Microlunatus sp.]